MNISKKIFLLIVIFLFNFCLEIFSSSVEFDLNVPEDAILVAGNSMPQIRKITFEENENPKIFSLEEFIITTGEQRTIQQIDNMISNYEFEGWFTEKTFGTKINESFLKGDKYYACIYDTTKVISCKIYAHWKKKYVTNSTVVTLPSEHTLKAEWKKAIYLISFKMRYPNDFKNPISTYDLENEIQVREYESSIIYPFDSNWNNPLSKNYHLTYESLLKMYNDNPTYELFGWDTYVHNSTTIYSIYHTTPNGLYNTVTLYPLWREREYFTFTVTHPANAKISIGLRDYSGGNYKGEEFIKYEKINSETTQVKIPKTNADFLFLMNITCTLCKTTLNNGTIDYENIHNLKDYKRQEIYKYKLQLGGNRKVSDYENESFDLSDLYNSYNGSVWDNTDDTIQEEFNIRTIKIKLSNFINNLKLITENDIQLKYKKLDDVLNYDGSDYPYWLNVDKNTKGDYVVSLQSSIPLKQYYAEYIHAKSGTDDTDEEEITVINKYKENGYCKEIELKKCQPPTLYTHGVGYVGGFVSNDNWIETRVTMTEYDARCVYWCDCSTHPGSIMYSTKNNLPSVYWICDWLEYKESRTTSAYQEKKGYLRSDTITKTEKAW